jgi:hypothetical protein
VAQQAAQDNLSESADYTVDTTGDLEDGLVSVADDNIQTLDNQSAKDPTLTNFVAVPQQQNIQDDDDDDDDDEDEIEDALGRN